MDIEVKCVETDDGDLVSNGLDRVISTTSKSLGHGLGNELCPDGGQVLEDGVGTRLEDIVRVDVIVADGGDDGDALT